MKESSFWMNKIDLTTWDRQNMLSENYSNKGTTEKPFQSDLLVPGDSSRDLFYPQTLGLSVFTFEGVTYCIHPKRVTKNC